MPPPSLVRWLALAVAAALTLTACARAGDAAPPSPGSGSSSPAGGAGLTPAPLVDPDEIISGGPPPDGIPPIDEPQFLPPDDADFLEPQEPVLAVEVNGDARAYPLQIMIWHEIVNDRIGGAHLRRGEPRQIRGGGDGHADGHAIHRAAGHRHQMSAA